LVVEVVLGYEPTTTISTKSLAPQGHKEGARREGPKKVSHEFHSFKSLSTSFGRRNIHKDTLLKEWRNLGRFCCSDLMEQINISFSIESSWVHKHIHVNQV
jgi:hypothetical protein